MKAFKIRCSAIGSIMTNAKKKGELSKGVQTFVQEWLKQEIYGRRKDISSKYLDKGNAVEDESIIFAADHLKLGFVAKNEDSFEDEFMTGTPDVLLADEVIDMKNSWDCFTFPLFEDKAPNKDYVYQLQGYMALTGKSSARLIYTLMNTTKDINYGKADNYDEIDAKYRIKVFEIARDEEVIKAIQERVKEINTYINQLNY